MSDLTGLALDMTRAANTSKRRVRGALGRGADAVARTAQEAARAKGWSADTVDEIYPRMARGTAGEPTSYVFGGGAVAYQETGTSRHPANPVLAPALDRHESAILDAVADAVVDGLV